ncbi:alpha/beta hydrolase [uncultured Sphingomonas sp.]|uniref:alpha/beta hydrolase n=1 Tax=uncultured Sphingomonas sp. TaxID=158754 RepID=UPI0035CB2228
MPYTAGVIRRRPIARRLAMLGMVFAAAGCSPPGILDTLNSLTPGDSDAHRAATAVAYGPAPRQRLDVWTPKSNGTALRPVVIFFYGGAWVKGSRGDYGFAGRAYAARGFVAVVPDYRLVPSVRFPAFVQDGALAIRWTRDHAAQFGGDPTRITIAGHSAGAYIGAMLALDPHYLTDIGVAPTTIRAAALLAGPYDFYPWDDSRAVDAFANWPRPEETQPIHYARADAPPMWLAAGTADTTVKPRNSVALADRLKASGAPVRLREYHGKSHVDLVMGLSKPFRGRAPTLDDSAAFLMAHSR